jgi:hypothetical protein
MGGLARSTLSMGRSGYEKVLLILRERVIASDWVEVS